MATAAQIAANRLNAQKSTGPRSAEGRARVARNAVSFGVYSRWDITSTKYQAEDLKFRDALFLDLAPANALEEALAAEVLAASRRLLRCTAADMSLVQARGSGGIVDRRQASIDRARVAAERSRDRALGQLRRLQTERCWRDAFLFDAEDLATSGVAEHREVFRGLSAERQFQMLPGAIPCPTQSQPGDSGPKPDITRPESLNPEIAKQSQFPAAA
jgi:hypothetical protein